MDTVVITPSFQVRLPKGVRDTLGLAPGQCLRVVQYAGRIELVPLRPAIESAALFGGPADGARVEGEARNRTGRP